jgi:hypothetical protein
MGEKILGWAFLHAARCYLFGGIRRSGGISRRALE